MTAPANDGAAAADTRDEDARMQGRLLSFIRQLWRFLADSVRDVFIASFAVYLVLLVMDKVEKGWASFFLNLNTLLWLVVASGVLTALTGGFSRTADVVRRKAYPAWVKAACAAALGALGAVAIYAAIPAEGWEAVLSSLAGGCAIATMAWLLSRSAGEGG